MKLFKIFGSGVALIVVFLLVISAGRLMEGVSASEIVVVQAPFSGKLNIYTKPGTICQCFGTVTSYPKRSTSEFEIPVRFNDGGHGTMQGSVQWEMPLSDASVIALHTQFGGPEAIQKQLVEKVISKSVYMTGPLMSSKESYAEKRNYLINYVEDQIAHGVYKTVQREVKVADPLTGQEKSAVVVDIVQVNNVPVRQEESALERYGIATSNFAIKGLPYDEQVEKQIQEQQKITMQVQTAIAESRQAEQRTITVEQQGKASAAEAKWAQEVLKAKAVTEAQQQLEVQTLRAQTAEQYRVEQLKKADADSTYRRQLMQADGALAQKLEAIKAINASWADAFANSKNPVVPQFVMGGSGGSSNGASSTQTLMDLLTAKTAKDLAVDLTPGAR